MARFWWRAAPGQKIQGGAEPEAAVRIYEKNIDRESSRSDPDGGLLLVFSWSSYFRFSWSELAMNALLDSSPTIDAALPENAAIRVRDLRKSYGPIEAVRGIDLNIQRGEIFGLIGPDGAGKTSTFQILGGVMPATAGEAVMLGRSARDARSYVGYLTQVFSLYHDLTVAENLRYVGELRRLSHRQIEERGQRYLEKFGMDRFTDRLA